VVTINLPNQITFGRLILTAICLGLLSAFSLQDPNYSILYWCLGLLILAAFTDWLDGYLARKRGQVTALGRILDPFVDTVLICGVFFMFIGSGFVDNFGNNVTGVPPWMVVVIIANEFLIGGLSSFCESQGHQINTDKLGKFKVVIQLICAGWIMLYIANRQFEQTDQANPLYLINSVLIWFTIAITVLSGLSCLLKARHALQERM